ncbi:MAG: peptidylprolyl isomerase [Thermodesulfobacteriota bacterium]|nr:peptidylprolyl isomerase [Thermodesulfobacteriota bacterium]
MRNILYNNKCFIKWVPFLFVIISGVIFLMISQAPCKTVDRIVAIVNEEIITLTELDDAVNSFLKKTIDVVQMKGGHGALDQIKREILNRIIDEKLIEYEIKRLGIMVSQRDLDDTVEKILKENSMSKQYFIDRLKTKGISLDRYKDQMKREMEKARFINHEIKAKITLNEDELKKYYTENTDSFQDVKEVKVQHILLSFPSDADDARIKGVYEDAVELLIKINNGEDFGKLAKEYSHESSADSGGVMGWFKRGEITPFLEKIVFDLEVGEVSDVIKSSLGYHIIKLMDRKEEGIKPFEEVKGEIQSIVYSQKVEKELIEKLKEMRKRSFVKIKL